jgi:hypothetical protein
MGGNVVSLFRWIVMLDCIDEDERIVAYPAPS